MPDSSMAAKRTIPPEEPSRDMARATAERNTVKVYLQSVLSRGGTILALTHAGHDAMNAGHECSPSFLKPNKGLKKYALLNNSHNNCHRNYANRTFLQN